MYALIFYIYGETALYVHIYGHFLLFLFLMPMKKYNIKIRCSGMHKGTLQTEITLP